MLKKLLITSSILVAIPILLFLALVFYPRPVDETPAWVFEGDAATIDYCDLPVLDGRPSVEMPIPYAISKTRQVWIWPMTAQRNAPNRNPRIPQS